MSLVKNLLTQWETREKNRTRNQLIKNLLTNKENGEENQKIIDIVDEKTFQPELRTENQKSRLVERKGTCLSKDLVDERFGQNKVLCSSSEVELPMVNYYVSFSALSAPEK